MVLLTNIRVDTNLICGRDAKELARSYRFKHTKRSYDENYLYFEQSDVEELLEKGYEADSDVKLCDGMWMCFHAHPDPEECEDEMSRKEIVAMYKDDGRSKSKGLKSPGKKSPGKKSPGKKRK